MGTRLRISCLLVAFLSLPLLSIAQSQKSSDMVSVRELGIPSKAHSAYQQGAELLARNEAARSLPYFLRAADEFAGYYEAYYKMGVAYLRLWRIPDAEQAFERSIDLSGSQYAPPLLAMGAVLIYDDKYDEAEGVIRKGLNLDPTSWSGHYFMGWALFGLNHLEEAEKSVREALRRRNDSLPAQVLLIEIHSREKNYSALLKDADDYLKLDPDSPAGARVRSLRDSAQRKLDASANASALALPHQ